MIDYHFQPKRRQLRVYEEIACPPSHKGEVRGIDPYLLKTLIDVAGQAVLVEDAASYRPIFR